MLVILGQEIELFVEDKSKSSTQNGEYDQRSGIPDTQEYWDI